MLVVRDVNKERWGGDTSWFWPLALKYIVDQVIPNTIGGELCYLEIEIIFKKIFLKNSLCFSNMDKEADNKKKNELDKK